MVSRTSTYNDIIFYFFGIIIIMFHFSMLMDREKYIKFDKSFATDRNLYINECRYFPERTRSPKFLKLRFPQSPKANRFSHYSQQKSNYFRR